MVGSAFTNEDFRSSECDWKVLLLCIETDELTELRKRGKMVFIAYKGPRVYSYEQMHIDLYECDALHGVNSKLNTIEYQNMI
jgi:hypothetical protein